MGLKTILILIASPNSGVPRRLGFQLALVAESGKAILPSRCRRAQVMALTYPPNKPNVAFADRFLQKATHR